MLLFLVSVHLFAIAAYSQCRFTTTSVTHPCFPNDDGKYFFFAKSAVDNLLGSYDWSGVHTVYNTRLNEAVEVHLWNPMPDISFGFQACELNNGGSGSSFTITFWWNYYMFECNVTPRNKRAVYTCNSQTTTTTKCISSTTGSVYAMQISNPSNDDACVDGIYFKEGSNVFTRVNVRDEWVGNDGYHYRYYNLNNPSNLPSNAYGSKRSGIPMCQTHHEYGYGIKYPLSAAAPGDWEIGDIFATFCEPTSIFAHYMPWFQGSDPGWHWPAASGMYYKPLIGYYYSNDKKIIEWQLNLMEHVGINGIIIDWYGVPEEHSTDDHAFIFSATEQIWQVIQSKYPHFKLGICYDLHSNPTMEYFEESMTYLKDNFFDNAQYMRYLDNNPIMLFWAADLNTQSPEIQDEIALKTKLRDLGLSDLYVFVQYQNGPFTFNHNDNNKIGRFNWLYPGTKSDDHLMQINEVKTDIDDYYQSNGNPFFIGSMYSGFSDHYDSVNYNLYGFINSDYGLIMEETYNTAKKYQAADIVQIVTWNDYSEGTMIEPHVATAECIKGGCNRDPYSDLIILYQFLVDSAKTSTMIKTELETITADYLNKKSAYDNSCIVADNAKVDCTEAPTDGDWVTGPTCIGVGCCWKRIEPNPNNYPYCYYPA